MGRRRVRGEGDGAMNTTLNMVARLTVELSVLESGGGGGRGGEGGIWEVLRGVGGWGRKERGREGRWREAA